MSSHERDTLVRELRERSHDVGGHPISFDDVRQSARRVQRRRNLAAGAVAAAVAGITIPAGLTLSTGLTTADGPVEEPTVASSRTAAVPVEPVRLTLQRDLEDSGDPAVDFLWRDRLVRPGDPDVALPEPFRAVAPYDGGWIAISSAADTENGAFMEADGSLRERFTAGDELAVSADGDRVGYVVVGADGAPTLVNAPSDGGEPETWNLARGAYVTPVGFLDDGDLVHNLQGPDGAPVVRIASVDGPDVQVEGLLDATGASAESGLVAGQTRAMQDGSCSAVVEVGARQERLWDTCDFSLGTFSPDGRYVVGYSAYLSGMGSPDIAILDARTGEPVVEYRPHRADRVVLTDVVWEDESTLLAVANEATLWMVLRLDDTGQLTRSGEPDRSDPGDHYPFWFAEQPGQ